MRAVAVIAFVASALVACREEVDLNVHGIPDEIRLGLPFCIPSRPDAADLDASTDADADAP